MTSDLDDFFARCDDVLTNWHGSIDSWRNVVVGSVLDVNGVLMEVTGVHPSEPTDDTVSISYDTVLWSAPSPTFYVADTP